MRWKRKMYRKKKILIFVFCNLFLIKGIVSVLCLNA